MTITGGPIARDWKLLKYSRSKDYSSRTNFTCA